MRSDRALGLAAALALAVPAPAMPAHIVWVELCGGAHSGRRIPLPEQEKEGPAKACHAGCAVTPGRRAARLR